jgi:hypothetical protein
MTHICVVDGCKKQSRCGLRIGKPTHCSTHGKALGMVNVKDGVCQTDGCNKSPSYSHGRGRRTHCRDHGQQLGMKNTRHSECQMPGCVILSEKKYDKYCANHFAEKFPDDPRTANIGNRYTAEIIMKVFLESHPLVERFEVYSINSTTWNGKTRRLRPDGVITVKGGYKALFELDGPHHFRPYSYGSKTKSDYKRQLENDMAKNRYAHENGMSMLRVHYKDYRNIVDILDDFLKTWEENGFKQILGVTRPVEYRNMFPTLPLP